MNSRRGGKTGNCGTTMTDLITVKLLLNRLISTLAEKIMTLDIRFYLNTPLARYVYTRLKLNIFPDNVIKEYGLNKKATKDGWIFTKIRKVMDGLPHAGLLEQQFSKIAIYQNMDM